MKRSRWAVGLVIWAAAPSLYAATNVDSIAIMRVGDGTLSFVGKSWAQNIAVDKYSLTNTLAAPSTVALPGLVLSAKDDDADGHLNLSTNGQYLTLGAYSAASGSAYPVSTTDPRSVAQINVATGNVGTASFTGLYPNQTINAVATKDGTGFFIAGGADTSANGGMGGLRYLESLSSSVTRNISHNQTGSTNDAYRNARMIDGQLYINESSPKSFVNRGVYQVTIKSGLPITDHNQASSATAVIVNVEGNLTDSYGNNLAADQNDSGKLYPKSDVALIDTDGLNGYDLAYSTGGKDDLEKWVLIGTNWIRKETVDAPPISIAGQNNEINALDYRKTGGGYEIYISTDFGVWRFTDTGGSGAFASTDLTATGVTDGDSRRYITSAALFAPGANQEFRGFALLPEPASLGVIALAGAMLGRRRKA